MSKPMVVDWAAGQGCCCAPDATDAYDVRLALSGGRELSSSKFWYGFDMARGGELSCPQRGQLAEG